MYTATYPVIYTTIYTVIYAVIYTVVYTVIYTVIYTAVRGNWYRIDTAISVYTRTPDRQNLSLAECSKVIIDHLPRLSPDGKWSIIT